MAEPSLLGIPVEIRERILRNCMVIGVASARKIAHDHPFDPPFASSQLLRVCSQLYTEGIPILYGENMIHYRTGAAMKSFVSKMTAETRSMIKHVGVSSCDRLNSHIDVVDTLTNLKTFNIFVNQGHGTSAELDSLFAKDSKVKYRDRNFGMPPSNFFRSLAGRPEVVEIGLIVTYFNFMIRFKNDERMTTELSEVRLVKFKIFASGLKKGKELREERVYSTDGKEGKDYTELLPKTQKHMLNSAGRVVRKDG
ncbi:Heat shock protein 60 [Venturia inaequalis]|nr:Heat shock protein 60 [Venturia inaequalis]